MQQLLAIFLSAVMMLVSTSDFIRVVSFKFNQDYISSNLCIDVNTPASMCYGSCYLVSEIEKNQDQKQNLPFLNQGDQSTYMMPSGTMAMTVPDVQKQHRLNTSVKLFPDDPDLIRVFHPPKA